MRERPSARPLLPPTASPQEWIGELKRVGGTLQERFPEDADALTLGGHIHQAFGDPSTAARCWEKCLRLHPQHAEAWAAVGYAEWEHGEFAKAVSHLQKAMAITPRQSDNYVRALAESLMHLDKPEEAIAVLEKARSVRGLPAEQSLLLGQAYLETKQYDKARGQFEKILAALPKMAKVHYMLATALSRLGETEKAAHHRQQYASLLQEKSAMDPETRAVARGRDVFRPGPLLTTFCLDAGNIYARHGLLEEAERHWLSAAALSPKDLEPRRALAKLYASQGREKDLDRVAREVQTWSAGPKSP